MEGTPVKLYVYDLSGGLAASMSRALVGRQIDGIWYAKRFQNSFSISASILTLLYRHTGIVAFGTEWYWSGILQQATPVRASTCFKSVKREFAKWRVI